MSSVSLLSSVLFSEQQESSLCLSGLAVVVVVVDCHWVSSLFLLLHLLLRTLLCVCLCGRQSADKESLRGSRLRCGNEVSQWVDRAAVSFRFCFCFLLLVVVVVSRARRRASFLFLDAALRRILWFSPRWGVIVATIVFANLVRSTTTRWVVVRMDTEPPTGGILVYVYWVCYNGLVLQTVLLKFIVDKQNDTKTYLNKNLSLTTP